MAVRLAQWVVGLAAPLILGFEYGPTTAFVFDATIIVLVIVGVYIVCDLACIGFYLRIRVSDQTLLHLVIPIPGIAAFVPAPCSPRQGFRRSFIKADRLAMSYLGSSMGVWLLLGLRTSAT